MKTFDSAPFNSMTVSLFAACMLCGQAFSESAPSLTITPDVKYQQVTMMGADMERSSGFLLKAANPDEIVEWIFKDIAMNVCRVQYDKHQEMEEGVPTMSFYDDQVKVMKKILAVNPKIKFFATLRSDYQGYPDLQRPENINNWPTWVYVPSLNEKGKTVPANPKKPFDPLKYGKFLADFIIHMHENGVPISYLNTGKETIGEVSVEIAKQTIVEIRRLLAKAGVPEPLMIGPGAWGIPASTTFVKETIAKGYQQFYAAFSTHNLKPHGAAEWLEFTTAAHEAGKDAWDEESAVGANGPTNGEESSFDLPLTKYAEKIVSYENGLNGESFFEVWSRGIAKETRSVYFLEGQTGRRLRGYYIMKDWANSLAGKWRVLSKNAGMDDVSQIAFDGGTKTVLWLVNRGDVDRDDLAVSIESGTIKGTVSTRTWSGSSPLEGLPTTIVPLKPQTFAMRLPAKSICCVTFER